MTLFQLLMAATVANLPLVATKVGTMGGTYAKAIASSAALTRSLISAAIPILGTCAGPAAQLLRSFNGLGGVGRDLGEGHGHPEPGQEPLGLILV